MITFFRNSEYRKSFFRAIGFSVIAAVIVVARATGHGRIDVTTIIVFLCVILISVFVSLFLLEKSYKQSLSKKK